MTESKYDRLQIPALIKDLLKIKDSHIEDQRGFIDQLYKRVKLQRAIILGLCVALLVRAAIDLLIFFSHGR